MINASRLPGVAILVCLLLVGGCKDSQEGLLKELVATIKQMTVVLQGVTDEASAKAANPKLQKLMDKMHGLKQRADAMPKASSGEQEALKKKYEAQVQEAMLAFVKEMMRVGLNPKLQVAVKDLQAPGK